MRVFLVLTVLVGMIVAAPSVAWADAGIPADITHPAPPTPYVEPPSVSQQEVLELGRIGEGWYLVTKQVNGITVSAGQGGSIRVGASTGTLYGSSSRIPVAKVLQVVAPGKVPTNPDGTPFAWPTDPSWIKQRLNSAYLDLSAVPPASPSPSGMDRQPVLTTGPDQRGSLTSPPKVNLIERLRGQGVTLTPEQEQWVREHDGMAVPGTLRVTLLLSPPTTPGGKFRLVGWVYNFEPDWETVIRAMPAAKPQGQPPAQPPADAITQPGQPTGSGSGGRPGNPENNPCLDRPGPFCGNPYYDQDDGLKSVLIGA